MKLHINFFQYTTQINDLKCGREKPHPFCLLYTLDTIRVIEPQISAS